MTLSVVYPAQVKKREFRSLWIQRINAAVQQHGLSYNRCVAYN
jgi:large subunit ribosomal protein L20